MPLFNALKTKKPNRIETAVFVKIPNQTEPEMELVEP